MRKVMEKVKSTDEYTIFKKRNGRFAVRTNKKKKWVNGKNKVQILVDEKLSTAAVPLVDHTPPPKPVQAPEESQNEGTTEKEAA